MPPVCAREKTGMPGQFASDAISIARDCDGRKFFLGPESAIRMDLYQTGFWRSESMNQLESLL
jgi:hypothetical protein